MKIFDAFPGIVLQKPRRPWLAVLAVLALACCAALAGVIAWQKQHYVKQAEKMSGELAAARAEVNRLKAQVDNANATLTAKNDSLASCSGNLANETAKIGAFARQAAACESIRTKLHLKG
jgi:cell division protein FtsB